MRVALLASLVLFAGCSATNNNMPETKNHTGFLTDYSNLKVIDSEDSDHVQRYLSPMLSTRGYTKIMLDPISFYPAPPVKDQISLMSLTNISKYANQYMIDI